MIFNRGAGPVSRYTWSINKYHQSRFLMFPCVLAGCTSPGVGSAAADRMVVESRTSLCRLTVERFRGAEAVGKQYAVLRYELTITS